MAEPEPPVRMTCTRCRRDALDPRCTCATLYGNVYYDVERAPRPGLISRRTAWQIGALLCVAGWGCLLNNWTLAGCICLGLGGLLVVRSRW